MPQTPVETTIIGVCGGSGSGKSTAVQSIVDHVGKKNVAVIQHDNYYRNQDHIPFEDRPNTNYDHPDSLETSLYIQHLKQLKNGKTIAMPQYDFENHTRSKKTITVTPKPIILLDGILLFENPEIRKLCDLKIFVDTDPDVRLARRLLRDVAERGRTYEFGIEQYLTFTKPMHEQFVEPSKRHADIIVPEGGMNNLAMRVLSTHVQSRIAEILS